MLTLYQRLSTFTSEYLRFVAWKEHGNILSWDWVLSITVGLFFVSKSVLWFVFWCFTFLVLEFGLSLLMAAVTLSWILLSDEIFCFFFVMLSALLWSKLVELLTVAWDLNWFNPISLINAFICKLKIYFYNRFNITEDFVRIMHFSPAK